jgi:serine O-acetyltransferase
MLATGMAQDVSVPPRQDEVHPQATVPDWGFFRLVFSDYRFLYRYHQEPVRGSLAMLPVRLLLSPSLQFAVLVRLAQRGPRVVARLVAYLQVMLFSSEVFDFHHGGGIELGAAVAFPHPWGIMIGPGSRIGSRVTIYHDTMIGTNRRWFRGDPLYPPVIGDDVIVGGASRVLGEFKIGEGSVIGLNVFVRENVPPLSTVLIGGVKRKGEWDDPRLDGREPPPPPDLLEISRYAAAPTQ